MCFFKYASKFHHFTDLVEKPNLGLTKIQPRSGIELRTIGFAIFIAHQLSLLFGCILGLALKRV